MPTPTKVALLFTLSTLAGGAGVALAGEAAAPRFALPIACDLGKTCFVQNYVDIDLGPAARDFSCGGATYDGHKGTDIRLLSTVETGKSVPVLAAAEGTIKGVRDGMPDLLVRERGAESVASRECGNGVVIDHGVGWETQYCHMLSGSIAVKSGDRVGTGQALGSVGYSGMADFAHVHFEVRRNGKPVDPFTGQEQNAACQASGAASVGLWAMPAEQLAAGLKGEIIATVFSGALPNLARAEYGDFATPVTRNSLQLVFVARLMNLRQGDSVRIVLSGPANFNGVSDTKPIDRNKATYIAFAGKKRTQGEWPMGTYAATVQIVRDGGVFHERRAEVSLQ